MLAAVLSCTTAEAQEGLRVFSSGAAAAALRKMAEQSVGGQRVVLTVAMPAVLQSKLAAGEAADVIVGPVQALDALDKDGRLVAGSRVAVARVGIGVAVKRDAAKPDIATAAALRAALLAAPSVVHPDPNQPGSNAGRAIARMIDGLGIGEAMRPKTIYRQAIAGGVEMVAKGEAALGLFIISEILPNGGVALAGTLPAELQTWLVFAAAQIAGSKAEPAARAYIGVLAGAEARPFWLAAGLEQVAGGR